TNPATIRAPVRSGISRCPLFISEMAWYYVRPNDGSCHLFSPFPSAESGLPTTAIAVERRKADPAWVPQAVEPIEDRRMKRWELLSIVGGRARGIGMSTGLGASRITQGRRI